MSLLGVGLRRGGLIAALVLVGWPALAHGELSWSAPVFLNDGAEAAMTAVACPSSSQCTAVDYTGKEVTFNPAAPRRWSAYAIDSTALNAVSCPTVSGCVAVDQLGREVSFDPQRAGTAHLARIDPGQSLQSISCPSASQCTAGDAGGRVITFDPGSPGTATTRSLSPAELAGISCPKTTQCTVIDTGHSPTYSFSGTPHLITFDPLETTAPARSIPLAGLGSQLECPSSSECVATGCTTSCGAATATFDPTSSQTPTFTPRDSLDFVSLACASSHLCTGMDGSGREVTFDPASTSVTNTAFIDPVGDYPKGQNWSNLACPATSLCAVVSDTVGAAEMTFNPRAPRTPPTVAIDDGAPAVGVSCPSSTECVTLGRVVNLYLPGPVGASVTLDPRSGSTGKDRWIFGGDPAALSCPTSRQCTMITKRGRACSGCSFEQGGEEWTFNPRGRTGNVFNHGRRLDHSSLSGISCPTATDCVATDVRGRAVSFNPRHPKRWRKYRLSKTGLSAIDCTSTRQCVAVDRRGQAIVFDPGAPGPRTHIRIDAHRVLTGLSCPSAEQCTAIDREGLQVTFNPVTGARLARHRVTKRRLLALACASRTSCVAISSQRAFAGNPLAGRWSQSRPAGATGLTDVACRPRGRCVVVDGAGHAYISRR